jgi:VWFA-related protein
LSKNPLRRRSSQVLTFLAKANLYAATLALLAGGCTAQDAPQPEQQPTFRSQSNVVLAPALVRDKKGALIYGLQARDFIVEDDGVEQAVRLDESPDSPPISLVVAIQLGRTATAEWRRFRTIGSMLYPILSEGRNRAAIVTFDSQVELMRGFTTNGALIAADIHRLQPGDDGAAILDAIGYSVALLKQEPKERQRVLLLVSETRDHGSHVVTFEDTVQAITDSNTLVYTLAFSPALSDVLDTLRGNTGHQKAPTPERTSDEIRTGSVMADGSPRGAIPFMPLLKLAVQAMRKNTPHTIAAMTGGEYELFASKSGFESRLMDFANHLHNRYLLSFEPKDPHPGLHRVSVRLRQSPDATIVARDRYWAAEPQENH